jgi:hypothetical protein
MWELIAMTPALNREQYRKRTARGQGKATVGACGTAHGIDGA